MKILVKATSEYIPDIPSTEIMRWLFGFDINAATHNFGNRVDKNAETTREAGEAVIRRAESLHGLIPDTWVVMNECGESFPSVRGNGTGWRYSLDLVRKNVRQGLHNRPQPVTMYLLEINDIRSNENVITCTLQMYATSDGWRSVEPDELLINVTKLSHEDVIDLAAGHLVYMGSESVNSIPE